MVYLLAHPELQLYLYRSLLRGFTSVAMAIYAVRWTCGENSTTLNSNTDNLNKY